jgi:hypothetical protein
LNRIGVIGAFAVIQKPTIPKSIWALGFVSLLMDVSSELISCVRQVVQKGGWVFG